MLDNLIISRAGNLWIVLDLTRFPLPLPRIGRSTCGLVPSKPYPTLCTLVHVDWVSVFSETKIEKSCKFPSFRRIFIVQQIIFMRFSSSFISPLSMEGPGGRIRDGCCPNPPQSQPLPDDLSRPTVCCTHFVHTSPGPESASRVHPEPGPWFWWWCSCFG